MSVRGAGTHSRRSVRLSFQGVLDQLSVLPAAAYGLRRLRRGYTGPAINVRRSTDNAAMDIGFLFNGNLDTGTLLSFVGSASGYVAAWYDQSGFGRSATQTTATAQPMIVNAGALVLLGGKPAIRFINAYLKYTLALSQPDTINLVHQINSVIANAHVTDGVSGSVRNLITASGANWGMYAGASGNTLPGVVTGTSLIVSALFNAASSMFSLNGTVYAAGNVGSSGMSQQFIGAGQGAVTVDGWLQEYTVFGNQGISDRQTLERNQGSFYGISVA